jgi:hypothetical protein
MAINIELIPADTTREAYLVQLAILRRLSPDRRLEIACRMTDALREIVAAGVRSRHPEYTEQQVKMGMIRLWLGEELFRKVYPGVDIQG